MERSAVALAFLVLVAHSSLAAADPQRISLGEVLDVAVRQSPQLADATIDVAVADARHAAAFGNEDWLIAARLNFLVSRDEADSGDLTGTDKVDSIGVEATASKLLSTGATAGLTGTGSYRSTFFEFNMSDSTFYNTQVQAFIEQPLLRDRGEAITRAAQHKAKTDLDAAELARQATARAVVRDVIDSYWQLALAHRDLEIRKGSLALAVERRRITSASVSVGQVARTELDAVDQIIATRKEEILGAELVVSERAIELRRLAGLEIGANAIDLMPTAQLSPPQRGLDIAQVVEAAIASSPELAQLAARSRGAEIDVLVAKNGMLPRLNVSLQAGPVGTGPNLSTATNNLVKFKGYQISGALDFSYQLGARAAEGNTRAAREGLRLLKVTERDLRAQIAVAAVRAVKQAQNAAARMTISKEVIMLATKNVEAEKSRFELGRSTNFDVLERQEELKQANLRLARATADYLRSLNIVDELAGTLLEKNGIELTPATKGP